MLGFARNIVFSGQRTFRCGEKLARVRDGCGRHRFAAESGSNCARNVTEGSRLLFFSSLLMLCYCVLHVLNHFMQWNWCIKAMCSTVVCCNSIVLCDSVCADHNGMALQGFSKGTCFPVNLWQNYTIL
jgi:hypothetical protein